MMQIWKGKSNEEGTKVMKQRKDGSLKEKKPQHLYLLLDDWSWGYSVRKIDLSFGDPDQQLTPHASVEPVRPNWHSLPSASFKFEAPRGYPNYFASAFDSKILAMQPMDSKFKNNSMDGILVYDVHMRSFIVGPQQRPVPVDPIYIPVGGRLFALAAGSFQMLHPPPCDDSDWKNFSWTWHALPDPPFLHQLVTSYAVHSDGRTIFVSIGGQAPATFSFDTAESEMKGRSRWKHDGHWKMPFNGRGYFAPELDAWVGLWGSLGRQTLRICAIDAVSGDLSLKMCEEELTCFATGGETIGATLVNMGGGSKFCLLESIYNDYNDGQAPRVGMRLTTFSLKYDKNGGLTMGKSRKVQHYSVPSEVTWSMLETLVAFCM